MTYDLRDTKLRPKGNSEDVGPMDVGDDVELPDSQPRPPDIKVICEEPLYPRIVNPCRYKIPSGYDQQWQSIVDRLKQK